MRLITKKQRTDLQRYEIESRTAKGYTREDYKTLIILTKDEDANNYPVFILRGTAAHPILNAYARTAEQRDKTIEQYKRSEDSRQAYKQKAKENPTTSTAANCAAAIRAELAKLFPNVKFTVRSSSFSMGNSVDIGWTDGPTVHQVEEVTNKYQYGHFDGMTDMYENSNSRDDIPQAKFVQTSRKMGDDTRTTLEAAAREKHPGEGWEADRERERLTREVWYNTAIPHGAKVTGIGHGAENAGSYKDIFCLTMEGGTPAATAPSEPAPAGTVQIIEYSAKAIAVIGETKPIKDKLKALGGKFNFRLSCGPGWIFPRTALERVTAALQAPTAVEQSAPAEIEAPEAQDEAGDHYYKEPGTFEDSLPTEKGHDPRNPEQEETPRTYKRSQAENERASKALQAAAEDAAALQASHEESAKYMDEDVKRRLDDRLRTAPDVGTSANGFFRVSGPETAEQIRTRIQYAEQFTPHKVEQYRERLKEVTAPKMQAHAETKQMFLF